MSNCDNCAIRKAVAKVFDLHWTGKDDCPFEGEEDECEEEEGE